MTRKAKLTDPHFCARIAQQLSRSHKSLNINEIAGRRIDDQLLEGSIAFLEEHLYGLGPGQYAFAWEHVLRTLRLLRRDDLRGLLLSIEEGARREVFLAWITPLRQVVGSCFGTAPAILVQREQPERFLRDMEQLIRENRLVRTFGGVEYAVPRWRGEGSLLRSWEYTLASFTEVKVGFSRWNLYRALGFENGLGSVILSHLQRELDQIEDYRAESLARLPPQLVEKICSLLPLYFQEAYDPNLGQQHRFEDSPAGFRLLYKHGRWHTGSWSWVRSEQEFVDCLCDFFKSIERELAPPDLRVEISRLITEMIYYLRSPAFLAGARARTGREEPWAYISGGSMETLISVYFSQEAPFEKRERIVRSAEELLQFLLELPRYEGLRLMESPRHAFLLEPFEMPANFIEEGKRFAEEIDPRLDPHFAHKSFPFIKGSQLPEVVEAIFEEPAITKLCESGGDIMIPAWQLQQICQGLLMLHLGRSATEKNYPLWIRQRMRALGLAAPAPCLFADTNWVDTRFGFVVNPCSAELELWRMDPLGMEGHPMTSWKPQLDGTLQESWVVYTRPSQYH